MDVLRLKTAGYTLTISTAGMTMPGQGLSAELEARHKPIVTICQAVKES